MESRSRTVPLVLASMVFGAGAVVGALLLFPPARALFERVAPALEPPGGASERWEETAEPAPTPADLDEIRTRLLDEQGQALREELRRLHAERIEVRRGRIEAMVERHQKNDKREYDQVLLTNRCPYQLAVALYYLDLDGTWITRGWWLVEPEQTVTTDAYSRNAYLYFYAENQAVGRSWNGEGQEGATQLQIVDLRFDHLSGETFVWDKPRTVWFFRRHTGEDWKEFEEVFTCPVEAPPSAGRAAEG